MRDHQLRPALLGEAVGTFILVFAGCGAIALGTLPPAGVAAAFGFSIMVSIYAWGHVSGAHFNPAVILAFAVGRHFPVSRVVPYWVAQVSGAFAYLGDDMEAEYVYANFTGTVLYAPTGAVEINLGDVWFADDRFVAARKDLFSATPPVVRSTLGREAPAATPLGTSKPRKSTSRRG